MGRSTTRRCPPLFSYHLTCNFMCQHSIIAEQKWRTGLVRWCDKDAGGQENHLCYHSDSGELLKHRNNYRNNGVNTHSSIWLISCISSFASFTTLLQKLELKMHKHQSFTVEKQQRFSSPPRFILLLRFIQIKTSFVVYISAQNNSGLNSSLETKDENREGCCRRLVPNVDVRGCGNKRGPNQIRIYLHSTF